jgi:hypothetical protein
MAKDAKGHGSEARGGSNDVPGYTSRGAKLLQSVMRASAARTGNQPIVGIPAHGAGVAQVGGPWHLNSFTHEIVAPSGDVAARMRLGKNNGISVDTGEKIGSISRSGGTALHDAVAMADYRAPKGSFPAEHIGGELHYLTGNEFAGHTVRRVK